MDIWSSKFLLPQHRQIIDDHGKPLPRPSLDEQRLEELDDALRKAVQQKTVVKITLTILGDATVRRTLSHSKGWIVVQTDMGIVRIPPADVLGIDRIDRCSRHVKAPDVCFGGFPIYCIEPCKG